MMPTAPAPQSGFLSKIESIKADLDYARGVAWNWSLRKDAAKLKEIAAVMEHKGFEIAAGELVLRAEREIAKASPAKPSLETGRGKKTIAPGAIDKDRLFKIRRANRCSDAVFEERLKECREKKIVPTRKLLLNPLQAMQSGNPEWYTPKAIIQAARQALGGAIDLDPASCEFANRLIKAKRFYTKDDDGLAAVWSGRVWLNPPYNRGIIEKFVSKFFNSPQITAGIMIGNNNTETKWASSLLSLCSAVCFPVGRVRFYNQTDSAAGAPLQGQMIGAIGVPPEEFKKAFEDIGPCLRRA